VISETDIVGNAALRAHPDEDHSTVKMKSFLLSALATQVAGHAIWQDMWVNGVDKGSTCVRLPGSSYVSNSPVTVSIPYLPVH
jgi:hypothetical protein